ncbi:MAG: hypothetical protein JRE81_01235 [Deltaproteobacteria bacterium]|nr:hypothetical protein [Deltaproteobacteria bacterium]
MKRSPLVLSLLAGLGVLMAACGDDGDSGGDGCPTGQVSCDGVCINEVTPTLAGDDGVQAAVFSLSCTFSNCHGAAGQQQAGLELSSVAISEENLVGEASTQVPTSLRVAAGDSDASYLMNKLLGEDLAPTTQQMPVGGMLCEPRLEAVRQWIDAGAPLQ